MTRYKLVVALFVGALLGFFVAAAAICADHGTPLAAPVRAAQLEADLDELRDQVDWLRVDAARSDLECEAELYRCKRRPACKQRPKCVVRANELEHGAASGFVHKDSFGTVRGVWMRVGARTPSGRPLAICVDAKGSWFQGGRR